MAALTGSARGVREGWGKSTLICSWRSQQGLDYGKPWEAVRILLRMHEKIPWKAMTSGICFK